MIFSQRMSFQSEIKKLIEKNLSKKEHKRNIFIIY
jgi:hypothetical protein